MKFYFFLVQVSFCFTIKFAVVVELDHAGAVVVGNARLFTTAIQWNSMS